MMEWLVHDRSCVVQGFGELSSLGLVHSVMSQLLLVALGAGHRVSVDTPLYVCARVAACVGVCVCGCESVGVCACVVSACAALATPHVHSHSLLGPSLLCPV